MSFDVASLSVAEIHRRLNDAESPPAAEFLAALMLDSRKGVRALCRRLQNRERRRELRRSRLDALLRFERALWRQGVHWVAGVDEAGVGPLAGPVVAAAVILHPGTEMLGIDDSKKLTPAQRENSARQVLGLAAAVAVGVASVEEIDSINILQASRLAMARAVGSLQIDPEFVLVDARRIPGLESPQRSLEKGDSRSLSIAAASIIAKTRRDRMMVELDLQFPGYGFARHKGYPTAAHRQALRKLGACSAHRNSFSLTPQSSDWCEVDSFRLK